MKHSTRRAGALVTWLMCSVGVGSLSLVGGCAGGQRATESGATTRVLASDVDMLTGAEWGGTLTYLDYTTKRPTTIRSLLKVDRVPGKSPAEWEMRIGYADEPHANNAEVVRLQEEGRVFRDQPVVERRALRDGSVRVITEGDARDDNRSARVRYVYVIAPSRCSFQKLVRFDEEGDFFERHVYIWAR